MSGVDGAELNVITPPEPRNRSDQAMAVVPSASVLSVSETKVVLIATEARFERAVFAPAAGISEVKATVPETFGKVYVLFAVRSTVVMIPAKRAAPPVNGKNLISSSVAVEERIVKGSVPPVAVNIFCAEVVKDVAEATPSTGVTSVGEVEKTRFVFVVPVVPVAEER